MWGAHDVTVRFPAGAGRHGAPAAPPALDRVSLDLPAGAVSALVGGDGAGRTTLLRALLGRVPLASGTVDVPDLERVGFQPASSGVWGALTVAENVAFVGAAYGMRPAAVAARGDDLLERAGLAAARDRLGGRLSGGMRQKLGFCLAVLHAPDLLLLDEPSTGVDPVSRVELWRLVAEAAAGGAAVALATTYLDEAERAATVLALDRGRVLASADPAGVVASVPGTVTVSDRRPTGGPDGRSTLRDDGAHLPLADRTWRRGTTFRTWSPPGTAVPPGDAVEPDLEDALVVLALAATAVREPAIAGARP
jgi:ABC-2 type transport system ATP-binding protein